MIFNVFTQLLEYWPLKASNCEFPMLVQPQTVPTVIPGSGVATASIELPGDADMTIDDMVYFSTDLSFPDVAGFRCAIYYGQGDYTLNYPATNEVRGELIFGTAQRPSMIGNRPWRLTTRGARGQLNFNFTNLSTNTTTVEFALRGNRRTLR